VAAPVGFLFGAAAAFAAAGIAGFEIPALTGLIPTAYASDGLLSPSYPWSHVQPWQSFDHAAIRRGFQVYQQVCASCHSLNFLSYRNLVNVAYTEDEVKAMAADVDVEDGPNDKGVMFDRPGALTDHIPRPYPNEQAARAQNAGAYPTDLSLIVKARPGYEDYIFALLTGYKDAPPGVDVKEGMSYNPYFYGSQIAMPQQLHDDAIEYDDGTDASISQMAKDVTVFLSWAAEPHQDDHKKFGLKALFTFALTGSLMLYWKRLKWQVIKNRITAIKK
jgi:ubiquinol-cytochrome c reductase cytochrome c1 subunit